MPIININQFTPAKRSSVTSEALLSHIVSRGTLSDSSSTWICKEAKSPDIARIEVLAQEFFRLIIPHQPETRLAFNEVTGVYYVLSEEVQGYRSLPNGEASKFENGTYTGLGQALVCALFLEEHDLKNGNIGLDSHNRVIKIDGDWSFASIQGVDKTAFELTEQGLSSLPYPAGIQAFNWLDYTQENISYPTSQIVRPTLGYNTAFRNEVNQALLKIVNLPYDFIEQFVDQYIPAGGEQYSDLIHRRARDLSIICLQNASFQNYLSTQEANEIRQNFRPQIASLTVSPIESTASVPALVVEPTKNLVLERLQVGRDCIDRLKKIKAFNPTLLQSYVTEKLTERQLNLKDVQKLLDLRSELDTKLSSLQSTKQHNFKARFKNELHPPNKNNDIISQPVQHSTRTP